MNIEQEIKKLRKKLDELEKQVNDKNEKCRYVPEYLGPYSYVDSAGMIIKHTHTSTYVDDYRISVGNCFKTKEEAKKYKRILINTQKLKDLAEMLNNGKKIDWNDSCPKYYIYLEKDQLNYNWISRRQIQGVVYCLDENFLDEAIEEIGKESLIELIKG